MSTRKISEDEISLEQSQVNYTSTVAPLPEPIAQTIEAIVELHKEAQRDVSQHQRLAETATTLLGSPAFLYFSLLVVALWMLPNILPNWNLHFDPPPFDLLQLALGVTSLPITIAVLINQERQEKLAQQQNQLSLHLNLLSEQKIAKIIALLEELRRDLPNVKDRYDAEADIMQQAADPQMVIETLEQKLEEELTELQLELNNQLPS